jgi:hypothetical protein
LKYKRIFEENQIIKTNKEDFEIIFDDKECFPNKEDKDINEKDKNRYKICLCRELQCLIQ